MYVLSRIKLNEHLERKHARSQYFGGKAENHGRQRRCTEPLLRLVPHHVLGRRNNVYSDVCPQGDACPSHLTEYSPRD